MLAVSAAPVGVFLMLRRMSLTGDAMAHAILPGAAIGYLIAGLSLGAMTVGGIVAGLVVAVGSGLVARNTVLREDSSLASLYLLSLALGVLIVSIRGNSVDLLHVLFGSVLALDNAALALLGGISLVSLITLSDLAFRARQLDQATLMTLEIFGLALVMYFVLAQIINFSMRTLERRLARGRMRGGMS